MSEINISTAFELVAQIARLESSLAQEQARSRRYREALEQIKNSSKEAFMNARIALVYDLAKTALQADETK